MSWNWELTDWPRFSYNSALLSECEQQFLLKANFQLGVTTHIDTDNKNSIIIDLICDEAVNTSEIEGEYLNRESIQASIRRQFGLQVDHRKIPAAEQGIAEMMVDLYQNFSQPLTSEVLFNWHRMLTNGRRDLNNMGQYRTHEEPMQVISGRIDNPKIHFEAPPSANVPDEMAQFIIWFNASAPNGTSPLTALTRSAIAHWYFVCIHPFEDGNGRIARAIAEKALSQNLNRPTLIALSHCIKDHKKDYYDILERSSHSNDVTAYLIYFSKTILSAQDYTEKMMTFIIEKTKLYDRVKDQINSRQEKAIARIFSAGLEGFTGGLSADKYIRLTGTSRATATRDLQDLVEKQVLYRTGEHKSTRYFLNIPH